MYKLKPVSPLMSVQRHLLVLVNYPVFAFLMYLFTLCLTIISNIPPHFQSLKPFEKSSKNFLNIYWTDDCNLIVSVFYEWNIG